MKDLKKGLREFSKILRKAKQKGDIKGYALIGGVAVSARSRPRATKDIDFLVHAEEYALSKTIPKMISKKGYEYKIFKGGLLDPINGVIRILDEDGGEFVDLIPLFWNWQKEAIENAEEIEIFDGIIIPIAKTEDLIVLKLKAGGSQDMLDAQELLKASKLGLDRDRLMKLAKRARVDKKLSRLLK
jgi:predicted nucleotidyltransferase